MLFWETVWRKAAGLRAALNPLCGVALHRRSSRYVCFERLAECFQRSLSPSATFAKQSLSHTRSARDGNDRSHLLPGIGFDAKDVYPSRKRSRVDEERRSRKRRPIQGEHVPSQRVEKIKPNRSDSAFDVDLHWATRRLGKHA